jgi:hypothetical protein
MLYEQRLPYYLATIPIWYTGQVKPSEIGGSCFAFHGLGSVNCCLGFVIGGSFCDFALLVAGPKYSHKGVFKPHSTHRDTPCIQERYTKVKTICFSSSRHCFVLLFHVAQLFMVPGFKLPMVVFLVFALCFLIKK